MPPLPDCSLHFLARTLNRSERRIQQLAKAGIVFKKQRGCYDSLRSVQSYLAYRKAQLFKRPVVRPPVMRRIRLLCARAQLTHAVTTVLRV